MPETIVKPIRISFVATYPPRQCGIATYTYDLVHALAQLYDESVGESENLQVVALKKPQEVYSYGDEVRFDIREQHRTDYRESADLLNLSQTEVVNIQHEFGIFGGNDGSYILQLLAALKKPVVTTLHTVLKAPTPQQLDVLKSICSYSSLVVVHSQKAVEFLVDIYGVPREKVLVIHHGVPDVPFLDPAYYKDKFHAEGRRVILTFGLLNPNKGIEVAIEAVASLVKEFPDVLYVVLGATHPEVKRRFGEQYRVSLERLVKQLKLKEHVVFHKRFVKLEELLQFLVAADICVTPYLSKEQSASGSLAYAIGCGKAVISTPYWYAEELLADERGCLVPFGDADALANQLRELLSNETKRHRLRKRAYLFGRQMIWKEVAGRYLDVFQRAVREYGKLAVRSRIRRTVLEQLAIPEINLAHLRIMTDNTGIFQHAIYATPNRSHGYCTDDNARAAIVALMNFRLFKDESILPLLHIYLSFLDYSLDRETGRARNFMSYDRRWLEEIGSEDCHGRTLWALGITVDQAPTEAILGFATNLFNQALPSCLSFNSPRAWAYSILGCRAYLERFGGDREARDALRLLAQRLFHLFQANSSKEWLWGEDIVAYNNARLPQALIAAGQWLKDETMWRQGLQSLEWLLKIQTARDGHLSVVGNKGWLKRGGKKARFDQQPIEVAALVDACYEAYRATENKHWCVEMNRCFDWFLGRNDLREIIYDFSTGGCRDGLQSAGANRNEGGESTVCWLMALHRMHEIAQSDTDEVEELVADRKEGTGLSEDDKAYTQSR
ncbi:MAG: glycosyl transferase family 1 [Candidatus Latescibacterota bacterium]|nr:MAG: glycosyl transferase family 1 [Candidatus Latescibacterota bacterium]